MSCSPNFEVYNEMPQSMLVYIARSNLSNISDLLFVIEKTLLLQSCSISLYAALIQFHNPVRELQGKEPARAH